MKSIFTIIILAYTLSVTSQSKLEKLKLETIEEGKLLYQSEMASWYGTDIFIAKYTNRDNIGGYFSYIQNNKNPTCIFFSKENSPKVIGTIVFDNNFDVNKADYSSIEREFSNEEKEYYNIRKEALELIKKDTLFKLYSETSLNLIPLIGKEKKVYVLTGYNGKKQIAVYGNDYLINFDKNNNVKKIKKLHTSYLPFEYGSEDKSSIAGMHNHLKSSGEIISATDICTTMLYQKFTGWETYYVMSEKYVSIWNCKNNELVLITNEAWKKINEVKKEKE